MIGSGVFEVEVEGEKIGFEFGMLASMHTEEIADMTIFEVFKKISTGRQKPYYQYFYGGLMAYNEFRGIEKKMTIPEVTRIMEKLGAEKCTEIYLKSINSFVAKNGKAPVVTGQDV
jgi:hypothetical protein